MAQRALASRCHCEMQPLKCQGAFGEGRVRGPCTQNAGKVSGPRKAGTLPVGEVSWVFGY